MSNKKTSDNDAEQIAVTAKEAERGRIAGILGHKEAACRLEAAIKLALTPDLPVESAVALLEAMPRESGVAFAAFDSAMTRDAPELGASGGDYRGDEAQRNVERVLAAAGVTGSRRD